MALDTFKLINAFTAAANHCRKNARSGLMIAAAVACLMTGFVGFTVGTLCLSFAAAATGSLGIPAAQAGYKAYKETAPAPAAPGRR